MIGGRRIDQPHLLRYSQTKVWVWGKNAFMHTPGLGVVWDSKHDMDLPIGWAHHAILPTKTSLSYGWFACVSCVFLSAGSQVSFISFVSFLFLYDFQCGAWISFWSGWSEPAAPKPCVMMSGGKSTQSFCAFLPVFSDNHTCMSFWEGCPWWACSLCTSLLCFTLCLGNYIFLATHNWFLVFGTATAFETWRGLNKIQKSMSGSSGGRYYWGCFNLRTVFSYFVLVHITI